MIEFSKKYPYQEEQESSIYVPLSEFTLEQMKISLESSMPATLKIYGFSLKGKKVNRDEMKIFLAEKFNYWNDDIDHEYIFDLENG